jgi:hypothetical protein
MWMRADMAKVIVERPRLKGWACNKPKGYQRALRRYGEDGPPSREGIKARWQGRTKSFNEHLGPLRGYLAAQVGRPWDKVYSEICAHIDRGSVVQKHILTHVADYVAVHVVLIDGVPCSGEGRLYGTPLHQLHQTLCYVCPGSGLLRRVPPPPKRPRKPCKKKPPRYIRVSDTLQCRFFDGAWHLVTLKPLPTIPYHCGRSRGMDVLLQRPAAELALAEARGHYGAEVYACEVRRLGRREQRQYPIPDDLWV